MAPSRYGMRLPIWSMEEVDFRFEKNLAKKEKLFMASPGYGFALLRFPRWLKEELFPASPGYRFRRLHFRWPLKEEVSYSEEASYSEWEGLRSLNAEADTIRLKASVLLVLLSSGGKQHDMENGHLQALLIHIRTVFQSADLDIGRLWADCIKMSLKRHRCWPMNVVDVLSSVRRRLELLQPDIHQVYNILSKSSRSVIGMDSEAAMKNLESLRENIGDLLMCNAKMVAPVKDELVAAKKSLRFLSCILAFTAKRCRRHENFKDLLIHAEFLVDNISCLLYLCCFNDKMNDQMPNEMKMHLSSQLHNFSPAQPDVREIYIKVLKASKSARGNFAMVDKFDLAFLDSLRVKILELPDTKLSFVASNKDQILSLHEEMRFLTICFTMYESSEDDQMLNNLLKRISAIMIDMGCFIYLLHRDEQSADEVKELKIAVSGLQGTIKTAKEEARKACDDMNIPTTPFQMADAGVEFHTTNARGIIRALTKDLHSKEMELNGPFAHQFKMLRKEMLSLIEAISEATAKHHVLHEQFDIKKAHIIHINKKTKDLITSFAKSEYQRETLSRCKLKLFVLVEEIKMIKMEYKDLQNQMMQETSASKLLRKIYGWGKETTTDYAVIFEGEAHTLSNNVGLSGIEDQLRWLETNLDLICPLKDEIKVLTLKAGFLKVFLSCNGKWHAEDGNLKVLTRILCVVQNAEQDLQRLWSDLHIQISPKKGWCLPMNMDGVLSSVLGRLQLLNPDVQAVYTILSESPRFITGISHEAVTENLNSLVENTEVLLKCNAELVAPLKEELEAVQKGLTFLRNFLSFTTKRCSKLWKLKDLIIHAEFLAEKMSCLLYLCCVNDKMSDQMVNEMKMHLSSEPQKFNPMQSEVREIYIKALIASKSAKGKPAVLDEFDLDFLDSIRVYLLELSNSNLSFITSTRDNILSLQEELRFLLTCFAMDKSLEDHSKGDLMSNFLLEHINAAIIDTGFVIYSLLNDEKNENMAMELELNKKVLDVVASVMVAKEYARKIYDLYVPKSLRSNFPRTNGQGFIGSLLQYLKELLNARADSVAPLKHNIRIVLEEVQSLSKDFSEIAKQPNQCEELQSQWTCFLDIAYQTEYVIDSFFCGDGPLFCHKLGLFNVIEEIKTIKRDLKAIKYEASSFPSQILLEPNFQVNNAMLSCEERLLDCTMTKVEIFGEEEEKIREQLTYGLQKLSILSIVGMPGIGKTTLADSVFHHSSVAYHFHVRARCSVSQVHDKRRLLLEILQQVTAESKQYSDDDDLEQKLYQSLKGKRYLLFLDDIWNIQPWKDIKASIPDDGNGSRIIFTSRFDDIAKKTEFGNITYRLSTLSEGRCWVMLQVKLFGNESCPRELVRVGQEIAANCKGLPLTVDLVAGILRVKERKEWKNVAESLTRLLFEDPQGRCRKVLELSYQNLPDDLKPCFLYFAAFPRDANVPTRDLTLLWIAEGFVQVQKGELRNLEDVAEDILNNLISRSLITISRRRPLGGVEASRVHDLLHEFAVKMSEAESFMLKIDGEIKFSPSSSGGEQWREQYRVCIYDANWGQIRESDLSGPRTRALICSNSRFWMLKTLNFGAFKLLRVLYIPNAYCVCYDAMFTLIHLGVLVIGGTDRKFFSRIHKFQNLETFIWNGSNRIPSNECHEYLLLDKISKMVRLRYFSIGGYVSFRYRREKIWEKSSLFDNLRTLCYVRASYEEDIEKILKLMPNLVNLKVLFYNPDGNHYPFPKLDFLKKLESLEVTHQDYDGFPYSFKDVDRSEGEYFLDYLELCMPDHFNITSFPLYLKKLVLSQFQVPWTQISVIGNLKYLQILELKDGAFVGSIWMMIDGQFPKLKHLYLDNLDIEEWIALEDHLSCLEHLHVVGCWNLHELPSCLAEIATLQVIKLSSCSRLAENSAKRIKEEQEEMGYEQLVVDIQSKKW